jgi:zinc transporter ZupT
VNASAVLAIGGAVVVYYLASHSWLKVVVGVAAGAALYLLLVALQAPSRRFEATTESRRAA